MQTAPVGASGTTRDGGVAEFLVVGATGTIGRALATRLGDKGAAVAATSRAGGDGLLALDLAAGPQSWLLPRGVSVAYLLAGTTALDQCERDPAGTRAVNVARTLELARRLAGDGAYIVIVSTNLVHAGTDAFVPATAMLAPQCVYGKQKAELERALLGEIGNAGVLRITKVAEGLDRLVSSWAASLARGKTISPFSDLVAAPLPVAAVVEALVRLAEGRHHGVFQIGADADIGYVEVARRLAERMGVDQSRVVPTTSAAAGVALVARPVHTTLETATTESLLGLAPVSAGETVDVLIERVVRSLAAQSVG